MKAVVDPELCSLCGLCEEIAPDVFELGEEHAVVKVDTVPKDKEEDAKEAADSCPEGAITIQE